MPEASRHRLLPRHHARAGDRGAEFAAPRARGPRRCVSCPGHRGPITALHPMPDARAPGPALDLTPALSLAGGWAPLPQRRFQSLPPSQTPEPVGQPQAMTRLLDLRKAELGPGAPGWKGHRIAARRDCRESSRWDCHTPALPHRPPARLWGPLSERLLCPTAITSSRAFPHGPPPLGPRDPRPRSGAAPMAASAAAVSSFGEDTLICLLGRRLPPCPQFGFNPW